jgi:predicted amino acid racemase
MTAPRLEIDLDKVHHNARTLVNRLAGHGISVTGVTKASLGSPEIAGALLRAGVTALGDSRIENIEALRLAGVSAPMSLIRSPMLSQADRVVTHAEISFNTEFDVINKLSSAAQQAGRTHGIILMVELGDLREGIMPGDLEDTVRQTLQLPNILLKGIGTNLACRSGNSGNLEWAFSGADTGRVNNLRLGEALLLGCEPLHRQPIEGLHTDAFTLIAEVIEAKVKPSQPWGEIAQSAFGEQTPTKDRGAISQAILAIGQQDTDPAGLSPPPGVGVIGASSDHLILDSGDRHLTVGAEVEFQLNYSALVRAMTSPFVAKVVKTR